MFTILCFVVNLRSNSMYTIKSISRNISIRSNCIYAVKINKKSLYLNSKAWSWRVVVFVVALPTPFCGSPYTKFNISWHILYVCSSSMQRTEERATNCVVLWKLETSGISSYSFCCCDEIISKQKLLVC